MLILNYYSNLLKREEFLARIADDADKLSNMLNDAICDVKISTAAFKTKDIETAVNSLNQAEQLHKASGAIIDNLKQNINSYIASLVQPLTKEDSEPEKKEAPEVTKPVQVSAPQIDEKQMGNILEAIKSLKDLRDSLPNDK